jgi:hypothetical protein
MKNYITVNTKSNFNNANGIKLEVVYFLGGIVSAKVPQHGYNEHGEPQGGYITADFQLKEITSITSK